MAVDPFPPANKGRMLIRGVVGRCPRCGGGRLFAGWLHMVERCPTCGLRFEREEGFFLGAFVINLGVMLVALAASIAVGVALTLPDPPPGRLALAAALVGVVVPILCYPMSRTTWSAIDLWMTPLAADEVEAAEEARPGL